MLKEETNVERRNKCWKKKQMLKEETSVQLTFTIYKQTH